MAVTFYSGSNQSSFYTASSASITLTQVPVAGDCVVVLVSSQGTPTITASGLGATWVQASAGTTRAPVAVALVGYGCSGTGDTVSLSLNSSEQFSVIVGVFAGVQSSSSPVTSAPADTNNNLSTTGSRSGTTGTASYNAGDLVVAALASYAITSWSTTTWSNGDTTTNLGAIVVVSGDTHNLGADFDIPTSGSSTSATFNWAGQEGYEAIIFTLAASTAGSPVAFRASGSGNGIVSAKYA